MSEWISVKDKYPDDRATGDYLVVCEDRKVFISYWHSGCFNEPTIGSRYSLITHWMPLPEPPEPEGPFRYCWQPENGVCGVFHCKNAPLPFSHWEIAFDNEEEGKRAVRYLNIMWAKHGARKREK